MDLFIDLEKTLFRSDNTLSKKSFLLLEELCKNHSCTILTNGSMWEARELLDLPNLTIVSSLENIVYTDHQFIYDPMDTQVFSSLLNDSGVYTLYASFCNTCYILKYQERMKLFYPNPILRICTELPKNISSVQISIWKKDAERILNLLSHFQVDVLLSDNNKMLLNVRNHLANKEDWVLKLKKSPAIGIGDSLKDYEFIQHCEVQVAMKNSESELLPLCKFITSKTNDADGALEFIDSYLKHQQA